MDICIITHHQKRHLFLRRTAPLLLQGIRRHNDVVIDMVFIDAGDRQCQRLQVGIAHRDRISYGDPHDLRRTDGQECFPLCRHTQILTISAEGHIFPDVRSGTDQKKLPGGIVIFQLYAGLIEKACIACDLFIFQIFDEVFLIFFRLTFVKIDLQIKVIHRFKLDIGQVHDGITHAKARQQKRCAATDADEHHQKPLAIAHGVAQHDLVQEA